MMDRRDLLKLGLTVPLSAWTSTAWAAPNVSGARMLIVFLRGGYDAASLLVPIHSDFYYESRPRLAIARPDPKKEESAASLQGVSDWALHPALRQTVLPLWQRKELSFIPFCGSVDSSRSHFETQNTIEWGLPPSQEHAQGASGFMNRLVGVLGSKASPISFTAELPETFRGPLLVPNLLLKGMGKPVFDERAGRIISSMYERTRYKRPVAEGFELKKEIADDMASNTPEAQAANRNASTPKAFEVESRQMARLFRDRFNLGFMDVGGWDTHINQGGATGGLATNLEKLGQGLSIFVQELGPVWKQTVVVVLSEFGRTFRENGTRGTDHGRGSVMWLLGGGIRGGQLLGEQIRLAENTLNEDRDLPILNEYRSVLSALFQQTYGLTADALETIFPQARPVAFDLV